MTKNDIRSIYTQKVTELLAQGYQIHPETMSGSQGEIAHIDLTNGSEILRVLVESRCSYSEAYIICNTINAYIDDACSNCFCQLAWYCITYNPPISNKERTQACSGIICILIFNKLFCFSGNPFLD